MLDQALPIGINFASPVTWFVFAVALIVLALTIWARRESASRSGRERRIKR